jgi:hypothetical protein
VETPRRSSLMSANKLFGLYLRLSKQSSQSPNFQFPMQWDNATVLSPAPDHMTAFLPHLHKSHPLKSADASLPLMRGNLGIRHLESRQ